jgi:heparan-alpha-glucosaminide N-acetyltransferase
MQLRLGQVGDPSYAVVNFSTQKFGEHGMYTFSISDSQPPYLLDDSLPTNSYLPLIIASCILGGLAVLYPVVLLVYRRLYPSKRSLEGNRNYEDKNAKKKKRVVSLDVFRGMCITIMIFVNYGGGGYCFSIILCGMGLQSQI